MRDALRQLLLRILRDLCQDLAQAHADTGSADSDLACPRRVDDIEPDETPGDVSRAVYTDRRGRK